MPRYSDHFTTQELACPLTGEIELAPDFILELERLRRAYARPMVVTSGCRTTAHNEWLLRRGYPASRSSFHLIDNPKYGTDCCAVDVALSNGQDFFDLARLALGSNWSLGIGATFVHLDRRVDYTTLPAVVYQYRG